MAKRRDTQSRADRIRQRRGDTKPRPARKTQDAPPVQAAQRSMPPVMVRGGLGTRQVNRRQPRRRYDIPLGAPGVEMRLPSMPIVRPGWRILSAVLVLIFTGALYYLLTSPQFRISAVDLQGTQRLNAKDMNKTLYGLLGKTIFEIQPEEVVLLLTQQYPELIDVNVRIGLPANLAIEADERQPVLTWVMEEASYWIDATGVAFPVRDASLELPVVQASSKPLLLIEPDEDLDAESDPEEIQETVLEKIQPEKFMDPSMVTAVKKLAVYAPADVIFVYHQDHGFGWQAEQGWQVYFGLDIQDIDAKLSVYESVIDHLVAENIQPALVDMEFVHAPYYRLDQ